VIDVSDLLYDTDFADSWTLHRSSGSFVGGRWVCAPEINIAMTFPTQPLAPKELNMVPEGDRQKGTRAFWSPNELYVTAEGRISDEIEWRGNRYKLINVLPWNTWCKAIGVQMEAK
jgi:hypothetical protein